MPHLHWVPPNANTGPVHKQGERCKVVDLVNQSSVCYLFWNIVRIKAVLSNKTGNLYTV